MAIAWDLGQTVNRGPKASREIPASVEKRGPSPLASVIPSMYKGAPHIRRVWVGGGGARAWPHHAKLVLCSSNGLLNVEDVTAGPNQHGGACVQDGLTPTVTGHHHAVNGDTAGGRQDGLSARPASGTLVPPSVPCQDPRAAEEAPTPRPFPAGPFSGPLTS